MISGTTLFAGLHTSVAARLGGWQWRDVQQYISARAEKIGQRAPADPEPAELNYLTRRVFPGRRDLTIGQVAPGINPIHVAAIVGLAKKIVLFDLSSSIKADGPYRTLLTVGEECFPGLAAEMRDKFEDRLGAYQSGPVYDDLDLVFTQDFNWTDCVQKALADVRARQGAVIIISGDENMPRNYAGLIRSGHLPAEYYVYSQKENLLCPVDADNLDKVYSFFNLLNGTFAGRTRSCLVLRNPL